VAGLRERQQSFRDHAVRGDLHAAPVPVRSCRILRRFQVGAAAQGASKKNRR
jgi:hypothetical protein